MFLYMIDAFHKGPVKRSVEYCYVKGYTSNILPQL